MRIALGLEYDGSAFCGWQSQPEGCAVQDHLEKALAALAGAPVRVHAAGRTDTGVHATAQVAHFDTEASRLDQAWVRGTNARLVGAARVLWAVRVAPEFHARYSARSRTYRYLLLDAPVQPAVLRGKVGWFHRPLDLASMQEAMHVLLGEHDFSAFRDAQCQSRTPVRQLLEARIDRHGPNLVFTFRANAFLHHMVRNLVGALVYVGSGRQAPAWIGDLLAKGDRRLSAPTYPPDGLYLSGVEYDAAFELPAFRRHPLLEIDA